MDATLALDDWRRRVALLYLSDPTEGEAGLAAFRRGRDQLFRDHPQSALDDRQRARFTGLAWFPYDPGGRLRAPGVRARPTPVRRRPERPGHPPGP